MTIKAILAAAALLTITTAAYAWGPGRTNGHNGYGPGYGAPAMSEEQMMEQGRQQMLEQQRKTYQEMK